MKKLLLILILPLLFSCSEEDDGPWTPCKPISDLEIPKIKDSDVIIRHLGYTLSYNEQHEQANWVAYVLTKEELQGTVERTDDFRPDPDCPEGSADDDDYAGSGYDRGHLAPAADMAWSETAMSESFFYSNMSPQDPSFKRGIWKRVEEEVRGMLDYCDSVYVITGPVLRDGLPTIGPNNVSVPEYYFKVLWMFRDCEYLEMGVFLLKNEKNDRDEWRYVKTVDSIEALTGIDFFYKLPDDIEDKMESETWQVPVDRIGK